MRATSMTIQVAKKRSKTSMPRCSCRRLALCLGLWLAGTAWATAAERPNVIVLLTDDQGYGDFSRHGNPVLKTPNLDRLAEQSVRLTDFHVAPMCTPTRG